MFFFFLLHLINGSNLFDSAWDAHMRWHSQRSALFSMDFEDKIVSDRYYLIYVADKKIPFENRWMGCASALLYSILTDRTLLIDPNSIDLTLFEGLSESFRLPVSVDRILENKEAKLYPHTGPKPREKFGFLDGDKTGEVRLFGCSSILNQQRQQILTVKNPEYFVPLLFLNEEFKDRLLELFPERNPFQVIAKKMLLNWTPDPDSASVPKSATLVFTEAVFDPALNHNSQLCLNSWDDSQHYLFIMSQHSQHYQLFAQKASSKRVTLGRGYKNSLHSDQNRLQDILYAAHNASSLIVSTAESPLGELIGAISGKPISIVNGNVCRKPSCCPCRPMRSKEPCYGGATLKAYVNVCVGQFSGNYAYADLFSRPEHIDACKSRHLGIQVVKNDEN